MRIKMCGDNCVQITDRASGITVVGTGASQQVKFFTISIKKNIV